MIHAAGVVLVRRDGRVLLNHRDDKVGLVYSGYWSLIGGRIEDNELPKKAALRELEEETGYKTKDLKHLVTESYIDPQGRKIKRHVYWTIYDGVQEIKCFEGQEMKFIKPSGLSKLTVVPGQERLFRKVSLFVTKKTS